MQVRTRKETSRNKGKSSERSVVLGVWWVVHVRRLSFSVSPPSSPEHSTVHSLDNTTTQHETRNQHSTEAQKTHQQWNQQISVDGERGAESTEQVKQLQSVVTELSKRYEAAENEIARLQSIINRKAELAEVKAEKLRAALDQQIKQTQQVHQQYQIKIQQMEREKEWREEQYKKTLNKQMEERNSFEEVNMVANKLSFLCSFLR